MLSVVAALLIAALIAATVILALPRDDGADGVIDGESFTYDGSVRYSLEAEKEFKSYMSKFLVTVISGFFRIAFPDYEFDEENPPFSVSNSSAVSDPVIKLYSEAGIPSEKLINLGKKLADYSFSEVHGAEQDLMLFFLEFKEYYEGASGAIAHAVYCPACEKILNSSEIAEEGICPDCKGGTVEKKYLLAYASPATLAARASEIDFTASYTEYVAATLLTSEESARLIYQMIYLFQDEEGKETVAALGRTRFSNIVVSAAALMESLGGLGSGSGSLIEARATAALAYELGTLLNDAIAKTGAETLLTAFGLTGTQFDDEMMQYLQDQGINTDELASVEALNAVLRETDGVARFTLYSLTEALLATDTPVFDALYYASAADTESERAAYKDLFTVLSARCAAKGFERGYAESELNDAHKAAEAFERVFERFAELEQTSSEVTADQLEALITGAEEIARDFAAVKSVSDIEALSAEDRAKISDYAEYVTRLNSDGRLEVGTDTFASTVFANLVFKLLGDVIKNVDF